MKLAVQSTRLVAEKMLVVADIKVPVSGVSRPTTLEPDIFPMILLLTNVTIRNKIVTDRFFIGQVFLVLVHTKRTTFGRFPDRNS